jgi:hypothetical protein
MRRTGASEVNPAVVATVFTEPLLFPRCNDPLSTFGLAICKGSAHSLFFQRARPLYRRAAGYPNLAISGWAKLPALAVSMGRYIATHFK